MPVFAAATLLFAMQSAAWVAVDEFVVREAGGVADWRGQERARVVVSGPKVTDDTLAAVGRLGRLYPSVAVFKAPNVTDAGVIRLAARGGITNLTLNDCKQLTDLSLAAVGRLTRLTHLDLSDNPGFTDAGLKSLGKLTRLTSLMLSGTELTGAGLAHLKKLKRLRELRFRVERKLDSSVGRSIAAFPKLEYVTLGETTAPDKCVRLLSESKSLRKLDLTGWAVTDAGVASLAKLTSLRTLGLAGTKITDRGVRHLGKLALLHTLYVDETGLTDAGVTTIARVLPFVSDLSLSGVNVTDTGVATLGCAPGLSSVTLDHTAVTDAGLAKLAGLPKLRYLSLRGCERVTPEGVAHLKRSYPEAVIAR